MDKLINKKESEHKALLDFQMYADSQIPILIENALLLKKYVPSDIKNPVLLFLLPRAINGILEKLILEIEQAWRLLNRVLKDLNEPILNKNDKDYQDLDKMRNELIAHFIDVSLAKKKNKHRKWYSQNYGSYEKTFELINKVANKINSKISDLIDKDRLIVKNGQIKISKKINQNDIERLLEALKEANIY